jgi:hypothetical protein
MNLHPADDVAGLVDGLERVTLPLKSRLSHVGRFGVGMYLPAVLADRLAHNAAECDRLGAFLNEAGLDPFTYNAFPAGGFGERGLKERVFEPTWVDDARLAFTRDVALVASALLARTGERDDPERHVSISTHCGMHATRLRGEQDLVRCAENYVRAAVALADLEADGGPRTVLSLEAEPRSTANDTRELELLFARVREVAPRVLASAGRTDLDAAAVLERHFGTCFDTCHAAVEFESTTGAVERVTSAGPLGKLQFSSALALPAPGADEAGRRALIELAEPAYLHQVTGARGDERLRVHDLPDLARALAAEDDDGATNGAEHLARWTDCDEWRCHFHVPVDLGDLGALGDLDAGGVSTTRAWADVALARILAAPERWGTPELHVEIETYTWDVLPASARGAGDLVDGLEREYRHVIERLTAAGWECAASVP